MKEFSTHLALALLASLGAVTDEKLKFFSGGGPPLG